MARMGLFLLLAMAGIAISAQLIAGQAPAPGPDCSSDLLELFPCLDFLSNSSVTTVAPDCCSALTNVSSSSPFCLCTLISPANANQSAQLGINDTRALQLPGLCSLNLNPASCSAILAPSVAPAPAAFVPASSPISPAPVSLAPAPDTTGTPSATPVSSPESSASPVPLGDCSSEINSLQSCLGFLTGTGSSPSTGCCSNLGDVVKTAPQCLCSLASSGGVITAVNATRVQELPSLCNLSASISDCSSAGAPIPTGSEAPGGSPPGGHGAKSAPSSSLQMVIAVCLGIFAHVLLQ